MKKQLVLFSIGILAGILVYAMYVGNKVEDKSNAILKVLQSNCECDQVKQFLYVKGLASSEKGISTETAEYELKNCKYSDLTTEANRINELLIKKVDGYQEIDRFTLEFVNRNSSKLVTISNGNINH
ncbi:hypothetical protein J8L88_20370 [Aquimarina sp. MMG015]|uniref:hypothetical protein n=1 Tax=unclassified Aquimarina TaxID=2627091 RepID=UPI000E5187B3|nr:MULTISPECIES: hypothetical protein [unclassified Aquimarina]AXT57556.1 hypothetical protein D1815_18050 [Aquimarina sp. AD1]MBQ4805228.1 hypothetical protein [Aquimarina sp. MMG015]RKN34278.1 hypothetical protein D7035_04505 [Aquimarina sp. AD1]